MYYLGINHTGDHDSSVALISDERVIAAAAEERFTRIKHDANFPHQALKYCLQTENIGINDLQGIACTVSPKITDFVGVKAASKLLLNSRHQTLFSAWPGLAYKLLRMPRITADILGEEYGYKGLFDSTRHHLSHGYSSFWLSGFEDAIVIVIDGTGEHETCTVYHGKNSILKRLYCIYRPFSLGLVYSEITSHLGFNKYRDEYKVMGLAAYGKPQYIDQFRKIVKIVKDGRYKIDLNYFNLVGDYIHGVSQLFENSFGRKRLSGENITDRHRNIAASLQNVTNETLCHIAKHAKQITGSKNICLSGGIALNGVANSYIKENGLFDEIFVDPAPDDSGAAIGAALHLKANVSPINRRPSQVREGFWGPEYENDFIKNILSSYKLGHKFLRKPSREAALQISNGKIIGWFQGRMEWGPRALGTRSILADPRINLSSSVKNSGHLPLRFWRTRHPNIL
jgi:carbamoyltransferase